MIVVLIAITVIAIIIFGLLLLWARRTSALNVIVQIHNAQARLGPFHRVWAVRDNKRSGRWRRA